MVAARLKYARERGWLLQDPLLARDAFSILPGARQQFTRQWYAQDDDPHFDPPPPPRQRSPASASSPKGQPSTPTSSSASAAVNVAQLLTPEQREAVAAEEARYFSILIQKTGNKILRSSTYAHARKTQPVTGHEVGAAFQQWLSELQASDDAEYNRAVTTVSHWGDEEYDNFGHFVRRHVQTGMIQELPRLPLAASQASSAGQEEAITVASTALANTSLAATAGPSSGARRSSCARRQNKCERCDAEHLYCNREHPCRTCQHANFLCLWPGSCKRCRRRGLYCDKRKPCAECTEVQKHCLYSS
ncbi:hypothetical protein Tdes44962_MAKER04996 [Teratosphaeria destructans]|uniref:Zn(2)-C6 fungal-type domain-containing protein n=1 Tax=Teratosphaeria destructans TaxID=418781 RepID=A0A9W7SLQ6_9PEZI|nr:hypothetical protein Tdes44962_MAKER04996 [Teratosphaeria destructans]